MTGSWWRLPGIRFALAVQAGRAELEGLPFVISFDPRFDIDFSGVSLKAAKSGRWFLLFIK